MIVAPRAAQPSWSSAVLHRGVERDGGGALAGGAGLDSIRPGLVPRRLVLLCPRLGGGD